MGAGEGVGISILVGFLAGGENGVGIGIGMLTGTGELKVGSGILLGNDEGAGTDTAVAATMGDATVMVGEPCCFCCCCCS